MLVTTQSNSYQFFLSYGNWNLIEILILDSIEYQIYIWETFLIMADCQNFLEILANSSYQIYPQFFSNASGTLIVELSRCHQTKLSITLNLENIL